MKQTSSDIAPAAPDSRPTPSPKLWGFPLAESGGGELILERPGTRVGIRVAVVGVFLFALLALAVQGSSEGLPVPRVHDEFAYLLTADTFLEGRLTNPTHPCWPHFDTFHVFQVPTYQAKYPPGQGASLALGKLLFGHEVWGVWIAMAAALAAITWMLAARLSVGWAVLGPLLFFANPFVFSRWGESYWGGGLALLGGALLGGALLRCVRSPSASQAGVAGLGLFLLANTRPIEGALVAVLSLPLAWLAIRRSSSRAWLWPLGVALLLILGFTAYYNHALTGDALRLPHTHWDKYASPHPEIQYYAGSADLGLRAKLARLGSFFFGDVLIWVLLCLFRRPSPRVLGAFCLVVLSTAVSVLASRGWPHYLAPAAPWAVLLLVEALRRLGSFRVTGGVVMLLLLGMHFGRGVGGILSIPSHGPNLAWVHERRSITDRLIERGGEHLVLVRYGRVHSVHEEWVYNAADIDGAPIVWARDLGEDENAKLLEHFSGRTLWRVNPDADVVELQPFQADGDRPDGAEGESRAPFAGETLRGE